MIRPNLTTLVGWSLGTLAYFGWFAGVMGLRKEHIILYVLVTILAFVSERTRTIALAGAVWITYWMIYDSLRVVPNYTVNPNVHIEDLYRLEKSMFHIYDGQSVLTFNEWCAKHTHPVLDLFAGILYLCWVPFPFVLGVWLYLKRPPLYIRFAYCFLLVNLLGFIIYYVYPAAPPWYVADYGFDLNPNVPRSPAGLGRFDQLTGTQIFHNLYTRNSNIFAAVPSLHSAYPLVAWIYAAKTGIRWLSILFGVLSVGIWCTAVYSGHHYIVDVLAGIGVALGGYFLFERVLRKTIIGRWLQRLEDRLVGRSVV
jgi:inositol phosphorylceramide synthase catalytic subunit